ncbi:MAG: hormogonium polysaccharide biosynthesis acetyltransferase HpsU [Cyanobacteria bacterium P01_E01_bin.6]
MTPSSSIPTPQESVNPGVSTPSSVPTDRSIDASRTASSPDADLDAEPWVDLRRYDQGGFDRGRSHGVVMLWWLLQAVIFPITLHNANGLRSNLLRLFGAKIGTGVVIRPTARFTYPWKVAIGDYSWIGDDVVFYSLERIHIGSHCVISQECYLCTGSHDIHEATFPLQVAPIRIGNGAWVATDCFVAPGVTVGANAVIGARSSVFADMPAEQVCFGSPCRPRHGRIMNQHHQQG